MEQVPKNIEGHGKFLENFNTVLGTIYYIYVTSGEVPESNFSTGVQDPAQIPPLDDRLDLMIQ